MTPTIDGLTLLEEIGRGGFGVVYRARQDSLGRLVAVKVLPGAGDDQDTFARFTRECRALGAVANHPNIATVYSCGLTAEGAGYLTMELLDGGTLAGRTATDPLSWREAAIVGVGLAGALETAHRVGVLHRDIKPENVIFDGLGTPKLLDFGIATVPGAFQSRSQAVSLTLAHAAPEVLVGARGSVASDVYALASTLFTAIHGTPAFVRAGEETLVPLLARIAADPVPDLRPDGVPGGLCDLLEQALAKDPAVRPLSAEQFGIGLAAVVAEHGGPALSPPVLVPPTAGAVGSVPADPVLAGPVPAAITPAEVTLSRVPAAVPAPARRRRGLVAAGVAAALALSLAGYHLASDAAAPASATGSSSTTTPRVHPSPTPAATGATTSASPSAGGKRSQAPASGHAPAPVVVTVTAPASSSSEATARAHAGKKSQGSVSSGTTGSSPPTTPPATTPPADPPAPSAPVAASVVAGSVVRNGPDRTPASVRVTLSWTAGTPTGEVTRYQVRRTLVQGGAPLASPVLVGTTATSRTLSVPVVASGRQWYRWQVRAVGPGGRSAWVRMTATLPSVLGVSAPAAVAQSRAVGLRVRAKLTASPDRAHRGEVYAQSLPPGGYPGGTRVVLSAYGRTG